MHFIFSISFKNVNNVSMQRQKSAEKPNTLLRDVEHSWAVHHTVSGKASEHFLPLESNCAI